MSSNKGAKKSWDKFNLFLAGFWLFFTVVFALWWFKLNIDNTAQLAQLDPSRLDHWVRQRRMIFWEGGSWIGLLTIGGIALISLMRRERARTRRVREFFASFTHEVKTSLASLRLQAEALQDEHTSAGAKSSPILDRLVADTVRLQLQLENSLFLASQDNLQLFIQPLPLASLVEHLREQWPTLKINFSGEGFVRADDRALRTIFSNLLQNAILHGGASQVEVIAHKEDGGDIRIAVVDNGRGFSQSSAELGQLFYRPTPSSGSGLGLYICRILLARMNGQLQILKCPQGFRVDLTMEGVPDERR